VTGLQCWIKDRVVMKPDNSIGLQSKSPDGVPQLGIMFSLHK
jgi:hypothetical protein